MAGPTPPPYRPGPTPTPTPTPGKPKKGDYSDLPAYLRNKLKSLPSWAREEAASKFRSMPKDELNKLIAQEIMDKSNKAKSTLGNIKTAGSKVFGSGGGAGGAGTGVDPAALDIPWDDSMFGDLLGGGAGLTAEELAKIAAETDLIRGQADLLDDQFAFDKEKFAKQFGLDERQVAELEAAGAFERGDKFQQQKKEAAASYLSNLLGERVQDASSVRQSNLDLLRQVLPVSAGKGTAAALGRMFKGATGGEAFDTQQFDIDMDSLKALDISAEAGNLKDDALGFFGMADGGVVEDGWYDEIEGAAGGSVSLDALVGLDPAIAALTTGVNSIESLANLFGYIPGDMADQLLSTILPEGQSFNLPRDANGNLVTSTQAQQQWLNDYNTKKLAQDLGISQADVQARLDAAKIGADASKYGADKGYQASVYGSDMDYKGRTYAADKGLEGTKYSADKGFEGTKYSSDVQERLGRLTDERERAATLAAMKANPSRLFESLYYQAGLQPSAAATAMDNQTTANLASAVPAGPAAAAPTPAPTPVLANPAPAPRGNPRTPRGVRRSAEGSVTMASPYDANPASLFTDLPGARDQLKQGLRRAMGPTLNPNQSLQAKRLESLKRQGDIPGYNALMEKLGPGFFGGGKPGGPGGFPRFPRFPGFPGGPIGGPPGGGWGGGIPGVPGLPQPYHPGRGPDYIGGPGGFDPKDPRVQDMMDQLNKFRNNPMGDGGGYGGLEGIQTQPWRPTRQPYGGVGLDLNDPRMQDVIHYRSDRPQPEGPAYAPGRGPGHRYGQGGSDVPPGMRPGGRRGYKVPPQQSKTYSQPWDQPGYTTTSFEPSGPRPMGGLQGWQADQFEYRTPEATGLEKDIYELDPRLRGAMPSGWRPPSGWESMGTYERNKMYDQQVVEQQRRQQRARNAITQAAEANRAASLVPQGPFPMARGGVVGALSRAIDRRLTTY